MCIIFLLFCLHNDALPALIQWTRKIFTMSYRRKSTFFAVKCNAPTFTYLPDLILIKTSLSVLSLGQALFGRTYKILIVYPLLPFHPRKKERGRRKLKNDIQPENAEPANRQHSRQGLFPSGHTKGTNTHAVTKGYYYSEEDKRLNIVPLTLLFSPTFLGSSTLYYYIIVWYTPFLLPCSRREECTHTRVCGGRYGERGESSQKSKARKFFRFFSR